MMHDTIPTSRLVPVYTTRGDLGALMLYPYLFSRMGEWIGWVASDRKVYSVHGQYVGVLTNDPRVIRKPEDSYDESMRKPPPRPAGIRVPASVPLPPMMPELKSGMVDVLDEMPELLSPVDFGLKDLD